MAKRLFMVDTIIVGLLLIQWLREGDHYDTGENGNYKINVGQTIKVNIHVNGMVLPGIQIAGLI
jgi:hypothetical protein